MDVVELTPIQRRKHHVGPHEIEPGMGDGWHPAGATLDPYAQRHFACAQSLEQSAHSSILG
jgi:hypothetical protein